MSFGSSPRVWGIPSWRNSACWVRRFIPTRVGNTKFRTIGLTATPVHPHACGEYDSKIMAKNLHVGSSPRVWGIPWHQDRPVEIGRFIPTRVGNTSRSGHFIGMFAVHPHACGEYNANYVSRTIVRGSSPRVWGIPILKIKFHVLLRFIPTRVGNTHHCGRRSCSIPVHPHACGEYTSSISLSYRK